MTSGRAKMSAGVDGRQGVGGGAGGGQAQLQWVQGAARSMAKQGRLQRSARQKEANL